MNRSRLWSLLYVAALLVLFIPALQPLLTKDFTCGYDNAFHLWRAVETEHLLRQGILFSRWAPDMAHGFGFPLFVFVSPASAYVAALFHLAGLGWPLALNATFALGMVLGGLFTFLLARDLFGARSGVVAAVAYVYAPYQAYEVFNRGSLWEAFAWAFPPLVLWALQRWSVHRERKFLLLGVLSLAALILTHQLFAFLFGPLLVGWTLVAAFVARDGRVVLRGAAMGLLALALSAFFWLPGLTERGWVQTDRLLGTWVFDYRNNFLDPAHLLSPPRTVDPDLINDWPPKALGLIPCLLALLSLVRWRGLDRAARWRTGLLLASAVGFAGMTLPLSRPLWDHLPLLPYVQFPWRFLGPAVLCMVLLIGALVSDRKSTPPLPNIATGALILLLILGNLGWFYPAHCQPPENISLAGMIAWERWTDTLGTTAKGEYLPIWVQRMPQEPDLRDVYAGDQSPFRFDLSRLPEGAQLLSARSGALESVVEIESPTSFSARYLALYYPGWRAWVDGQPVEVTPTEPEGLIAFEVPAGRHTVRVRFGETPLRWIADGISILGLLTLVLLTTRTPRMKPAPADGRPSDIPRPRAVLVILSLSLLVLALKLGVIDRVETPLRRSRLADGQLQGVDVAKQITFDGQFRLLGHKALPPRIAADSPLEIQLYWQDTVPGGPEYRVGLTLEREEDLAWNNPYLRSPRWHRQPPSAYLWPPDGYALTAFELWPLPGTPPGVYHVVLGVFDESTLTPYPARGADGEPLGLETPLGQVEVTRPQEPWTPGDVSPQYTSELSLGSIRLIGYNLDREEAAPGDPFLLTLFWRAEEAPQEDFLAPLRLLSPEGGESLTLDLPPVRETLPTTEWQAGDLWRGQHPFRLPANLDDGEHTWELQICEAQSGRCSSGIDLGPLRVDAPERRWEVPPLDVEMDARLGEVVSLLGATVEPGIDDLKPGTPLTVTLAWRAEAEMNTSYRVFLHLLGPDGEVVAQSDGEPANWTRPTTGWLPGEVVLDKRVLTLPVEAQPGEYVLQAGMYTIATGRLQTAQGLDVVRLTAFRAVAD